MSLVNQIDVFIISDNRLFIDSVTHEFAASKGNVCLRGWAATLAEATEKLECSTPSTLLLDTGIEAASTVEFVFETKVRFPTLNIIVMGLKPDSDETILEFIEAGASGYILEDSGFDELLHAIESVHRKQTVCSPRIAASIIERLAELSKQQSQRQTQSALTPRELEVLELITQGLGNKQIAQQLNISLFTAKNHVHNILMKLQVRYRRDAISQARQNNFAERAWLSRLPVRQDWISNNKPGHRSQKE